MNEITTSHEFPFKSDALWELLADFAHIERWWPRDAQAIQIEKIEIEGEGVGLVRHIFNVGFPHAISERLDFLDPEKKVYKLSMVKQLPAGLTEYQATGVVTDVPGGCRLEYVGRFAAAEQDLATVNEFLQGVYQFMYRGLEEALERESSH